MNDTTAIVLTIWLVIGLIAGLLTVDDLRMITIWQRVTWIYACVGLGPLTLPFIWFLKRL